MNEKPLKWIASSYKDLMALPRSVQRLFGHALSLAQARRYGHYPRAAQESCDVGKGVA